MVQNFPLKSVAATILLCSLTLSLVAQKTPVQYANPLVGTASLDDPKLLGNAPPPGEEARSRHIFVQRDRTVTFELH